jgi:biopolymer transport protein ExbD
LAKNPELLVVINADDGIQHGKVVEIMDQARNSRPKQQTTHCKDNP